MTQWLSQATGSPSHGVRIGFHDPESIAIFLFLFVVTAPICEEILYRGLLVVWLRRPGLSDFTVLFIGSIGANHFRLVSFGARQ